MKRLHQIVGLVLLVLWVPITSHCTWENVPGLEFLKCATDSDQPKDCEEDTCAQIESANYKVPDTHTDFLPPAFTALFALVILEFLVDEQPTAIIETPPEISSTWQFSCRTALPPRAPSFVS